MFFHQYKYRIKFFLKMPTVMFWALVFPIILGTLFQCTFGSKGNYDTFETIPVAIVIEQENDTNKQFLTMMTSLTFENGDYMFDVKEVTRKDADELLSKDDVYGIITLSNQRDLIVARSGMNESIIQQFLNQYLRSESYITDIATNHPEDLPKAVANLTQSMDLVQTTSLAGSEMSYNTQYFYALIAMVCMFGSYLGIQNAKDIQANLSAVAARRCVSASKKITLIIADTFAALTIHFLEIVIVFFYLQLIGVDLGHKLLLFFLTCFIGSLIGILIGQFLSAAIRCSENAKDGICTSVSLILSFLSGLMFANIKDIIEKNAPIINRINPAALITDCFYSLSVFDDYTRYFRSLITLVIIAVILLTATILFVRRERYESI